ncbi:hypothetical protein [Gracilibacillus salinarum]|uniref:Uncharacterized protein n=1 Tax=Gracilibacillus salinarum TaxID=2932255 RepID=A0ABY4GLR1_9BACI|nr:hypothetical protein [Gracilibacillus salinarum]UOQ85301.1 hypothetical protein MUN87_22115 [Gracilibacillus salinarum]
MLKRIFTSVIAPCILYVSFLVSDIITGSSYTYLTGTPFLITFLIIYSYSFPFFLLLGVPASILIDKIDKGVRLVNYVIAGFIVGLIMKIINVMEGNPLLYDLGILIFCTIASMIFYFTLKSLEFIFTKAFGKHVSKTIY